MKNVSNVNVCVRGLASDNEVLWVTPVDAMDWMQEQKEAGLDEEFIITDYEAPFSISEYDNIEEIVEKAEMIENLTDDEVEVLQAVLENYTNDFEDALKIVVDGDYMMFPDCRDMSDVAYQYVEETGLLAEIPEHLQYYFDYGAYGRDMNIEGYFYYLESICGYVEIFG